jgi:hypothetical protein
MSLVAIAWPGSEPESLAMVSLLRANEIPCFVRGGHFASMLPGLQIASYNSPTIMVPGDSTAMASELLSVFTIPSEPAVLPQPRTSFLSKLRMIVEVMLFGRFVAQPVIGSSDKDDI